LLNKHTIQFNYKFIRTASDPLLLLQKLYVLYISNKSEMKYHLYFHWHWNITKFKTYFTLMVN